MQKTLTVIALFTILLLSGCGTTGETVNYPDTTYQEGSVNQNQSAIPPHGNGHGLAYDLSGYLLPVKTLEAASVTKIFYITKQESNGYFETTRSTLRRYLEGTKDDLDRPIVNVFEGDTGAETLVEHYLVRENRIDATFYDADGNAISQEQYPRYLQVGGDMLRSESGACVLKEHIEGFDMEDGVIPYQAEPNGNYGSVLHFYCGTADGVKIDRYYAEGWGQILAIRQQPDGSTLYSVLDQNSYQESP